MNPMDIKAVDQYVDIASSPARRGLTESSESDALESKKPYASTFEDFDHLGCMSNELERCVGVGQGIVGDALLIRFIKTILVGRIHHESRQSMRNHGISPLN